MIFNEPALLRVLGAPKGGPDIRHPGDHRPLTFRLSGLDPRQRDDLQDRPGSD